MLHLFGLDPDSARTLTAPIAQHLELDLDSQAHEGGWSLLQAKGANADRFYQEAQLLFPRAFVADNPFSYATDRLRKKRWRIALAESCTGGGLAAAFSAISGVSDVFEGGVITYSNRLKTAWLGVDPDTLDQHGAVSEAVIEQMVAGVLKSSRAECALATSGVAGPSGGTAAKPVGTVFVASGSLQEGIFCERLQLQGERAAIQRQSGFHALRLLLQNHLL